MLLFNPLAWLGDRFCVSLLLDVRGCYEGCPVSRHLGFWSSESLGYLSSPSDGVMVTELFLFSVGGVLRVLEMYQVVMVRGLLVGVDLRLHELVLSCIFRSWDAYRTLDSVYLTWLLTWMGI